MKHRNLSILLSFVIILLLFACNPQREARDLLRQAQALVDTQPEDALHLIDSIFYPERSLNEKEYMSYLVTWVQARYRNHSPIDADTVIFVARDYFAKYNQDVRQTALAYFYSGCVYLEREDFENAMEQYKHAAEYIAKTNDTDLQGLIQYNIGDLLQKTALYIEALEQYKIAESFFANSLNDNAVERQTGCFMAIGLMYMISGQSDSAFVAYHKGLELAKNSENIELMRLLMQNISATYIEVGEYEKAENYLRQSFELNNDIANLSRYYLNFAMLFTNTSQPDSLAVYVDKLKQTVGQSDDLYLEAASYHFLATNARTNEDFNVAFHYQQQRNDVSGMIYEKRLEQSIYEAKQRFDYQRYQDEHTQTLLRRQRWSIFFLTFSLVVSLFTVFMYRRMLHQRNRMLSLQNVINTLKQTNSDLQVRKTKQTDEESNVQMLSKRLSEALLWKFDMLFKVLLIKTQLDENKKLDREIAISKFSSAVFGKDSPQSWDILMEIIEEANPGFLSFIKNRYPQFTDTEYKVAALSFAKIQSQRVAAVLGQSKSSVDMARSNILKKMNLRESAADFYTVLWQEYHLVKNDQ
jgi:tetratricopeptide (TPR) repeat protein